MDTMSPSTTTTSSRRANIRVSGHMQIKTLLKGEEWHQLSDKKTFTTSFIIYNTVRTSNMAARQIFELSNVLHRPNTGVLKCDGSVFL